MSTRLQQTTSIRQTQETTLKPQMIQSLKILALPMIDLEPLITQELIENPLLELNEDGDDEVDATKTETEKIDELSEEMATTDVDEEVKKTIEEARELSETLDEWNEYHGDIATGGESQSDDEEPQYDKFIQAEENHKVEFINEFDKYRFTDTEYYYIYDLIDNSNEYGFLPKDFDI